MNKLPEVIGYDLWLKGLNKNKNFRVKLVSRKVNFFLESLKWIRI